MNKTIIRSEGGSLLIRNKKIPAYQERNLQITDVAEKEAGVIQFSLSSEEPYERWFGTEILRHSEEAVNLSRINGGNAAFLFNHNRDDYIGV